MKYKKVIMILLIISVLLNVFQLYNVNKYKTLVMDNLQSNFTQVFSNANYFNKLITKIIDNNETDKLELNELYIAYEKIMINTLSLRDSTNKLYKISKTKINNFSSYAFVLNDLSRYISKFKDIDYNIKISLDKGDIEFLKRLKRNINDMEAIKLKYSYEKNNMSYLEIDSWHDIVIDLSNLSFR